MTRRVKISDHAWFDRWLEYTDSELSRRRLAIKIAHRLDNEIRTGLYLDDHNYIHLPFKYGLVAVMSIEKNCWFVITFHKNNFDNVPYGVRYSDRELGPEKEAEI